MKKVIVGKGTVNELAIRFVQPEVMDKLQRKAEITAAEGGEPLKLYLVSRVSGLIECAINITLSSKTDMSIFLNDVNRETHIIVNSWHPDACGLRWHNPVLAELMRNKAA